MRDHLQKRGPAEVELRPGKSGQFDVTVDGTLRYTRSKTGRFPTDDEIEDLAAAKVHSPATLEVSASYADGGRGVRG